MQIKEIQIKASYDGYSKSYEGNGGRNDLNNHSNQMNSNNSNYRGGGGKRK